MWLQWPDVSLWSSTTKHFYYPSCVPHIEMVYRIFIPFSSQRSNHCRPDTFQKSGFYPQVEKKAGLTYRRLCCLHDGQQLGYKLTLSIFWLNVMKEKEVEQSPGDSAPLRWTWVHTEDNTGNVWPKKRCPSLLSPIDDNIVLHSAAPFIAHQSFLTNFLNVFFERTEAKT